jgi:erythronate-4-phosphate dehydrogenase
MLGVDCLVTDPPLQDKGSTARQWASLEEIGQADVISLHVPLTKTGPYPTHHLVNEDFLRALRPDCLLINTSRGAVVDNRELLAHLDNNRMQTVLDVWEGEPAIDFRLLERTSFGTPHIAGYSLEGKLNGTRQVYEALCGFLDAEPAWRPLPPSPVQTLTSRLEGFAAVRNLVLQAYDIRRDDVQLRRLMQLQPAERPAGFDQLRRDYPLRREFSAYRCQLDNGEALAPVLHGLGFTL